MPFFDECAMGSRLHFQRLKEGPPLPHHDDIRAYKREYAEALDERDPLKSYRDQFIIPSKKDLLRKKLVDTEGLCIQSRAADNRLSSQC